MVIVWDGLKGPEMKGVNALIGPSIAKSPRRIDKKSAESGPNRLSGKVSRFFSAKGYGFITPDQTDEPDVFVHVNSVPSGVELRQGMRVSYEAVNDNRSGKTRAANVRVIHN